MVFRLFMLFLAVIWMTSGCIGTPANPIHNELVIGVVLPLSGEYREFGIRSLNAMKLAQADANAVGGVDGRPVRLAVADSGGTESGARRAMTQLVMSDGAAVVMGGYSTAEGMGMKALADEWKFPVVLTQATGDMLTEDTRFVSRSCFPDRIQSSAMAYYLRHDLKLNRIAILFNLKGTESYSRNLAFRIGSDFIALGGTVVSQVGFSGDKALSELELEQITARNPEAIVLPVYPETALAIIGQLRRGGFSGVIVGSDAYDSSEMAAAAPENCIYSTICFRGEGTPDSRAFTEKIQRLNGVAAGNAEFMGYEGLQMVLAACRGAKNSSDAAKNLRRLKSFTGLGKAVYLDKERNALRPVPIIRFTQDGPKLVREIAPELL